MKSRPDALHVGFSKCASTFLQHFFESHPDIYLINQSHFFAPFDFSDYPRGTDKYRRLYEGASDSQVALESDEHILLPLFHPVLLAAATTMDSVTEVAGRIKAVAPSARIIMVVRSQANLIVSRYSEYILGGGTRDFEGFVSEFLQCSTDGVNYFQNYYARIARIFFEAFGEKNVLVLTQEGLSRDEEATIARLCRFLGVPMRRPARADSISRRVGLSRLGITVMKAFNRLVVRRQEMSSRRADVRIPYLLYKILQRMIRMADYYLPVSLKGDKNAVMSTGMRARIREIFAEDNENFSSLIGTDLKKFGY